MPSLAADTGVYRSVYRSGSSDRSAQDRGSSACATLQHYVC